MKQAIGDPAAIEFAIGFYQTVFAEENYGKAFQLGCNAVEMKHSPEHLIPIKVKKVSTKGEKDFRRGHPAGHSHEDRETAEATHAQCAERVRQKAAGQGSIRSERGRQDPPAPELLATLLEPSLSTIAHLARIEDRLCERADLTAAEIVAQITDEVCPLAGRRRRTYPSAPRHNASSGLRVRRRLRSTYHDHRNLDGVHRWEGYGIQAIDERGDF